MHKYALWAVYLFSFPLSPFDKMKVPLLRCQRGSLRSSKRLNDKRGVHLRAVNNSRFDFNYNFIH